MENTNVGFWQLGIPRKIEAIVLGKALARADRTKAMGGLAIVTVLVAAGLAFLFSKNLFLPFWVILALLVAMWGGFLYTTHASKPTQRSEDAEDAFA